MTPTSSGSERRSSASTPAISTRTARRSMTTASGGSRARPGRWGSAAALDAVRDLRRAFSEFRLEADRVIPGEGYVTAVWRARGRHTGEYQGVPATGVDIDVETCEIYEFRGGKV